MREKFLIAASVLIAVPASAAAPTARPEAFEALLRCRTIADAAERLACFDGAAASLQSATEQREVVVIDRKQIRETKRTLFGLPIPSLPLFGGDDEEEEEVNQIEGVVASARKDANGRWLIALKEGGVWRQIDSNMLGSSPKPGMKVEIERGAVGSFKMRVGGQPGIKVRRES